MFMYTVYPTYHLLFFTMRGSLLAAILLPYFFKDILEENIIKMLQVTGLCGHLSSLFDVFSIETEYWGK